MHASEHGQQFFAWHRERWTYCFFVKFSLKWQKMRKSGKWGLAETPSAQFRLEPGKSKCTHPTYPRAVYKSAVRTLAPRSNRLEVIADFPQKSRFLGVFRRCFSRLSPHPGQSGKSHLLSILIIYRYKHAYQVSGKSYGIFLRYRLKWNKTVYIWTGTGRRLGVGPYPLLDCQNPLKKRRPPRLRGRVVRGDSCHADDRRATARQRTFECGRKIPKLLYFVCYKTCLTFVFYVEHSQKADQVEVKI